MLSNLSIVWCVVARKREDLGWSGLVVFLLSFLFVLSILFYFTLYSMIYHSCYCISFLVRFLESFVLFLFGILHEYNTIQYNTISYRKENNIQRNAKKK